ncbi:MAG: gamma-glutamyltransferase, partial [Ghiorsea sp.]
MNKTYFLVTCIILSCSQAWAESHALPQHAAIATAHPLATQAGIETMQQGGNAFDAAAAVALTLGVVEPMGSGIGGGGFFLLYIAKEKRYIMIDARETSPQLAAQGQVYQQQSSIDGPQSAGVPGLIAGVDHLIQKYGHLSREKDSSHAMALAKNGFKVSNHYQRVATWRKEALSSNTAKNIYLHQGKVPTLGSHIRQPALAATLLRFAKHGADDFYRGETAARLVADMKRDGGLIRKADLNAYHIIERQPVRFKYQGFEWISASLPSSGGIVLAETLGILKNDDLNALSTANRTHLLTEAMKLAYKDRNQHLGDSDFVPIPDLLNPKRLQKLRKSIRFNTSTPSTTPISDPSGNGVDTTHFSILDSQGNMVSATLSINYGFGSAYVSPSTGILLNDEMDDFATQVGKPNAYGLVQGKANAVAPQKRMLSSMSPTFIQGNKQTFIVGTPGGSRII